ncbi:hypothetical protein CICLE_v10005879mg [Citrus x clementina]|uniref:Uncharacterized protein n=1 Tax=Citrus clementina TaxID=85681 RepID=V4S294_CITCL|nr:hypothetical protein CICLE_v10005879mg [Citrus x clementina]
MGKFHVGFDPPDRSTCVLTSCFSMVWSPEIETTAYTPILEMKWTSLRSFAEITLSSKSVADLRHSISYTTLELEQTRLAVQEELKKRDDQLVHLKDLLSKVIRERDAAHEKCQRLLYEKLCFNSSSSNKQLLLCQEFLLPKQEIESYDIRCGIKYPIPPNSENVQAKLEVKTKSEVAVILNHALLFLWVLACYCTARTFSCKSRAPAFPS